VDPGSTGDPKVSAGSPTPLQSFILSKLFGVYGSYADGCDEGLSYVGISGNKYCGAYFPAMGATSKSTGLVHF
jgi:hypothetical protein